MLVKNVNVSAVLRRTNCKRMKNKKVEQEDYLHQNDYLQMSV